MLPKHYYPTYWSGCNPIHEVRDWSKVRKLIRDARRGDVIPPIVIDGPLHSGSLITGTHRAAANDILCMMGQEPLIDYVNLDNVLESLDADAREELQDAIDSSDFGRINDILDR